MKRKMNYLIRISIIVLILIITKSTTNVFESKVENDNINKTIDLSTMALKVIEVNEQDKFRALDSYTGDLTGYVYNCPLCNGKLACTPNYNVKDGTTMYEDSDYGTVYIVASSNNLPCGTIVRFNSNRVSTDKEVLAIVLDRGVRGNALDLLVPSEDYALSKIGRSSITYDVLRNGWVRSAG
ncbi:MAG: hypothetical protein K2M17_04975 [Bacilli bacterium]|nr:hypothetical protein [Bacilli bacterium]